LGAATIICQDRLRTHVRELVAGQVAQPVTFCCIPTGDVALRFWVRDDGDGDVAPARGLSRTAKVDGEWTEDEGAADKVRNGLPPCFVRVPDGKR
jgi:hypothetical protein